MPEPLLPEVMVRKDALLMAVQAQPLVVVTEILPVPAASVTDWLAGVMEKVQGAPACVTVKV